MRYYNVNDEEKFIKKFFKQAKQLVDETNGIDASDKEVRDVLRLMRDLACMSLDQLRRDDELELRLEKEPGGFLMDKDYGEGCCVCGSLRGDDERWYDGNGVKCMLCQRALDSGLVPVSVARDKASFYSDAELGLYFNLEGKVLTEWIRAKLLVCKVIRNAAGGRHFRLFLMRDNEGFLPPKTLLEEAAGDSGLPWFHCVDPFEFLKGYGIIQFLRPVVPVDGSDAVSELVEEAPKVVLCHPCTFPAAVEKVVKRKARRKKDF